MVTPPARPRVYLSPTQMPQPRKRRSRSRSSAKPRGAKTTTHVSQHTSVPTGRAAYVETRRWLLEEHGPVCAYCGVTWNPRSLTLDHVTPRKGQTAYDRRDNLVLACKRCNSIKADKPFLSFLLGQKKRAVNLLHYGEHLSEGILDLCRQLAGDETPPGKPKKRDGRIVYGNNDDEESPYRH